MRSYRVTRIMVANTYVKSTACKCPGSRVAQSLHAVASYS